MLGTKPRTEDRTKVKVRAGLRDKGPAREASILDISTRGLLATSPQPPAFGEFVEIMVDDKSLVGHVKWSNDRRFGIVFQERISVINFLSGAKGSITLPRKSQYSTVRRTVGATLDDSRRMANLMQFIVFVAFVATAAYFLAGLVGDLLGVIELGGKR